MTRQRPGTHWALGSHVLQLDVLGFGRIPLLTKPECTPASEGTVIQAENTGTPRQGSR